MGRLAQTLGVRRSPRCDNRPYAHLLGHLLLAEAARRSDSAKDSSGDRGSLAILASVQHGTVTLLTSEALEFEISRTPDEQRRREATAILTLASERLTLSDATEQLAESFAQAGLSAIDALHVALAATAGVNYFVTADDKLLRRAKSLPNLSITPISLLSLVFEISQ